MDHLNKIQIKDYTSKSGSIWQPCLQLKGGKVILCGALADVWELLGDAGVGGDAVVGEEDEAAEVVGVERHGGLGGNLIEHILTWIFAWKTTWVLAWDSIRLANDRRSGRLRDSEIIIDLKMRDIQN